MDDQLVSFFRDLSIVLVFVFAFLTVLGSVFGVNVGTFVAGLGIGGLAIALAARETLENLFASFTLFLDLPFVVGDKIQLDKVLGKVEKIGFRSTRVRTDEGSLINVPNRLITAQSLENQTSRVFSGVEFTLKLQTDVSVEIIQEIVADIQQYVENHNMIYKPDTGETHFYGFGDNSLDVVVNYHIATNSSHVVKAVREEINLKIMHIIEQSKANYTVPVRKIIKEKKIINP
jgi:MscS family membrane protein